MVLPKERLEMGDSEMKINLTKLLVVESRVVKLNDEPPTVCANLGDINDYTSPERPYSFELSKGEEGNG